MINEEKTIAKDLDCKVTFPVAGAIKPQKKQVFGYESEGNV